jgi:hypothetical protein
MHLLDLPTDEHIEPIDYILDYLVEGVTFLAMRAPHLVETKGGITHV